MVKKYKFYNNIDYIIKFLFLNERGFLMTDLIQNLKNTIKNSNIEKTDGIKQLKMFNTNWWKKEWQDMPEFIMEDLQPFKTLKIHFSNQKDIDDFAKLINQKILSKTKFLWYPKTVNFNAKNMIWEDENEKND